MGCHVMVSGGASFGFSHFIKPWFLTVGVNHSFISGPHFEI